MGIADVGSGAGEEVGEVVADDLRYRLPRREWRDFGGNFGGRAALWSDVEFKPA